MAVRNLVGKLVILGDQAVGKTSLCTRYMQKSYSDQISPTIGAAYCTCKIKIEDIIIKLNIWDTAGQERFRAMTPLFYRNANAALLVFDLTDAKTFDNVKLWVLELKRNIQEALVFCLVGNKLDLTETREVSRDEAGQYAKSIGACYYECSAKTDQGVDQIFLNISAGIIRLYDEGLTRSLRIYSGSNEAALIAVSSNYEATDIGQTEEAKRSINNIAHATSVSKCC